ncbi:hypothetical protein FDZ74_03390 [bacterium]|nr:MAG: hypothetical protein FDZ74_03390 [bacterium]
MNSKKQPALPAIVLAVLIGAMLLVTAVPAILYFPAQRFLFRPDAITEELLASDLADRMPDLMAGWIMDGIIRVQGDSSYLSNLDRQGLTDILKILLPPDWTAIQSALAARQVQDYLLGRSNTLAITLDLSGISRQLAGEALPVVAARIVSSWENCSALDVAELALAMAGNSSASLPYCQPPEVFQPLVIQAVESGLQQYTAQIPVSVTIDIAQTSAVTPGIQSMRLAARLWLWTPWLALGLAFLLLLVLGGSLRPWLLSVGLPLSLAGVITAELALVMAMVRDNTLTPWLEGSLVGHLPEGLAVIVTPALVNVFSRFCLSALVWGGAAFLLGVVLVIVSRMVRR